MGFMKDIVEIEANTSGGNDYIIGDVHGAKTAFQNVLTHLNDDDRLFLVGDLIDRGEDSAAIVDIIIKKNEGKNPPVVYAVRGNHEEDFLTAYDFFNHPTHQDSAEREIAIQFLINGGGWIFQEPIRTEIQSIWRAFNDRTWSDEYCYAMLDNLVDKIQNNPPPPFIEKLENIQNYIHSLPSVLLVGNEKDEKAFIVCHADMPLSQQQLKQKITASTALTSTEKKHIVRTRPKAFMPANEQRNLLSTRVYCGHNAIKAIADVPNASVPERNQINLDVDAWVTGSFLVVNHTQNQVITSSINSKRSDLLQQTKDSIQKQLDLLQPAKTAAQLDAKICFIIKNSGVHDRKQQYYKHLKLIIPSLEPSMRKDLAKHLLNSQKHLLQVERHTFFERHSNETRTMHQVMWELLKDTEDKPTIKNIKIDEEEFHLSRHVEQYFKG